MELEKLTKKELIKEIEKQNEIIRSSGNQIENDDYDIGFEVSAKFFIPLLRNKVEQYAKDNNMTVDDALYVLQNQYSDILDNYISTTLDTYDFISCCDDSFKDLVDL